MEPRHDKSAIRYLGPTSSEATLFHLSSCLIAHHHRLGDRDGANPKVFQELRILKRVFWKIRINRHPYSETKALHPQLANADPEVRGTGLYLGEIEDTGET